MNFVILTHNNEKVFPLLDSLVGQKVWIVDDESERAYVQRMQEHPSKPIIMMRRLLLDFSAQRNHILQFIPQNEWICMIDSDEQLEFDPNELVKCSETNFGAASIALDRYNWVIDASGERKLFSVEKKVRCYRNTPSNLWVGALHEHLPEFDNCFHFSGKIIHEKTQDYWDKQSRFYEIFKQKILLSYCVSEAVLPDFREAQFLQPKLPFNVKQLAVSNRPIVWFNDIESIWDKQVGDGESFNLAVQRNLAIGYAIERGYDWLVILDVDSILLDIKHLPESGYSSAMIWKQHQDEPLSAVDWNQKERWQECSWFVLGRDIFSKNWCRFDESYKGAYHQDLDFHEHVLTRNGISRPESGVRAAHLWHPQRMPLIPQNEALFQWKRKEFQEAQALRVE